MVWGSSRDVPAQVEWAEVAFWPAGEALRRFPCRRAAWSNVRSPGSIERTFRALERLPELSPPVWGFTLSSSPLSRFCFLFYFHLSVSLTDLTFLGRNVKLPTSHPPPSVSSKCFLLYFIFWALLLHSHFSSGRLDALESRPGFSLWFCKFLPCRALTLVWKALECRLHGFSWNVIYFFLNADWPYLLGLWSSGDGAAVGIHGERKKFLLWMGQKMSRRLKKKKDVERERGSDRFPKAGTLFLCLI